MAAALHKTLQPLKIAMLVKALPMHRPGGQENHAWLLARGLVAEGHHVTVVTTAHPNGEDERTEDGVRVVHLKGTAAGKNSWAFFKSAAKWAAIFDGEFDLYHAQGFAGILVKQGKTPLVSTVHGTVWSETPLARQVRPLLSLGEKAQALWRYAGRTMLGPLAHRQWRRSQRLIVDSEFTRGELLRLDAALGSKIDVVPLGIEMPAEAPARDFEAARLELLSVGRLDKVRGLGDLLEALSLAPALPVRLSIAGSGPDAGRLAREISKHGLESRVRLLGRVDQESLDQLWRESHLFVNPEWSQPAFGLTSLEALAWGLPVLGTKTGATPEIVTPEVGWLVAPRQPGELATILKSLVQNRPILADKAEAARCRAAGFPVERMVAGTISSQLRALGRF